MDFAAVPTISVIVLSFYNALGNVKTVILELHFSSETDWLVWANILWVLVKIVDTVKRIIQKRSHDNKRENTISS